MKNKTSFLILAVVFFGFLFGCSDDGLTEIGPGLDFKTLENEKIVESITKDHKKKYDSLVVNELEINIPLTSYVVSDDYDIFFGLQTSGNVPSDIKKKIGSKFETRSEGSLFVFEKENVTGYLLPENEFKINYFVFVLNNNAGVDIKDRLHYE